MYWLSGHELIFSLRKEERTLANEKVYPREELPSHSVLHTSIWSCVSKAEQAQRLIASLSPELGSDIAVACEVLRLTEDL